MMAQACLASVDTFTCLAEAIFQGEAFGRVSAPTLLAVLLV